MSELKIFDKWMKVNGVPITDLESYIYNYLVENKDCVMMIGTDSKKNITGYQKQSVKYLSVICFRIPNKGAHVIKRIQREEYQYRLSLGERLGKEIEITSELALWIRENMKIDVDVHVDVNPDVNAGSNEVYKMYKGYFESLGFKCEYKPDSAAATAVADYYLGE